jgi:membrane-bound serine protease (ClpP class)
MRYQATWNPSAGAYDIGMTAVGVSLLVIGAVLILVEAHIPQLGLMGGPGVVLLGVGAALAVGGLGGGLLLGILAAIALVGAGLGVLALTVGKGMAVRRRAVRAGPEHLIGHLGEVRRWEGERGSVLVDGALWDARLSWPDEEDAVLGLHVGDPVVVERRHGLTLCVRPAERWELVR